MTNGNQIVTELQTEKVGKLLKGSCRVNGVWVPFYYSPIEDKFASASLRDEDYWKFAAGGNLNQRNWKYLICGSIAHTIKNNL